MKLTILLNQSEKKGVLIVVDTNILVNALKSKRPNSKSVRLIEDILNGKHHMCVSTEIMSEYRDVLHRIYLNLPSNKVDYLLSWIRINSVWIEPKPTTPREVIMVDEKDRCFFDVSRCLHIKLITRNHKHYPVHELITLIDEFYP